MEYIVNTPEWHYQQVLRLLGNDVDREGLQETPKRYIKFLEEFTKKEPFNFTVFKNEGIDEMIVQTKIPFYSLCEHHTVPFFGTATIAYIPNENIVGLSKLARTVDYFANALQNQERITTQIADFIQENLNPAGVGVQLRAQHLCMCMRGVKKHDAWTITTKLLGVIKESPEARNEFLNAIEY